MSLSKEKLLISTFIITTALIISFVFLPARKTGAIIPFGGPILNVTYCTCSFNTLLTVGPPVPGNYVFQPGVSIPFPFGQVYRPGPFVLGNFAPGGTCLMWAGKVCFPLPAVGTILMVGTSL